jgi:hypothetical protein
VRKMLIAHNTGAEKMSVERLKAKFSVTA